MTPVPARSRRGNGVTARRWASILRDLGHDVHLDREYGGGSFDVLIALHAWRSAGSVERFHERHPDRPIVVGMAGTDLYEHIHSHVEAQRSIELATRIVLLQRLGIDELPEQHRAKARLIYQSAQRPPTRPPKRRSAFEVCVLAHLRPVKDPLRAARAARLLPDSSRVSVLHAGAGLDPQTEAEARAETASNPRYYLLGELPRWKALRLLARCRLLVLSSRVEGGANVVCEALAAEVPVLSSRISGSIGILGEDYPGYFAFGDTEELAALLLRCESEPHFYEQLGEYGRRKAELVDPANESRCWGKLLRDISVSDEGGEWQAQAPSNV